MMKNKLPTNKEFIEEFVKAIEDYKLESGQWLKAHAWKACKRNRFEGSDPSLSAINKTLNGNIN